MEGAGLAIEEAATGAGVGRGGGRGGDCGICWGVGDEGRAMRKLGGRGRRLHFGSLGNWTRLSFAWPVD